ncbi:hypothetical protein ABW20_dc0108953 [Dactylellina cionopaga]|nr:hypothetical protein ABW20_dc0108953 [Dactylellina cionopaga]
MRVPSFQDSPDSTTFKITSLSELPPKTFKISPSTDALRYAQAQETPPGWPTQQAAPSPIRPNSHTPSHTPLNPPANDFALFGNTTSPQNFNADFELFGPSDSASNTTSRAIPDSFDPSKTVGDAVFNLGYTTSLPSARNWSASASAHNQHLNNNNSPANNNSLVQRSPFVNPSAEFDPALIDSLSDQQRVQLVREFNRRQRKMEDDLLTLAGLEASPLHANDMTFSPNNPLFHDFSPFIGTIPYTGRTNDTLDDSPTGLDTPLFGADEDILEDWTPLFTSEEQMEFSNHHQQQNLMEHQPSADALVNPAALMLGGESSTPPLTAIIPSRQFSTDSGKSSRTPPSPTSRSKSSTAMAKRASLTGVNRRKPVTDLPPVQFDPANPVDIKRARNTMAARKSRARRVEKMDELAEAVEKLQAEAQQLKEEKEFYKNLARQHGALVD